MAVVYEALLVIWCGTSEYIVENVSKGGVLASSGVIHADWPVKVWLFLDWFKWAVNRLGYFWKAVACPCPSGEALWAASLFRIQRAKVPSSTQVELGIAGCLQAVPVLGNLNTKQSAWFWNPGVCHCHTKRARQEWPVSLPVQIGRVLLSVRFWSSAVSQWLTHQNSLFTEASAICTGKSYAR